MTKCSAFTATDIVETRSMFIINVSCFHDLIRCSSTSKCSAGASHLCQPNHKLNCKRALFLEVHASVSVIRAVDFQ